jgi:protein SCO1/2
MRIAYTIVVLLWLAMACNPTPVTQKDKRLPYLGPFEVLYDTVDGQVTIRDTVWHTIPDFAFIDQDSQVVNKTTFTGKVYVADFFFTTCPSICPKMKEQMLRIYQRYADNDTVALLSHSIDPKHDTVAALKSYADKLGISSHKWHLVTGNKEDIYNMATYYFIAVEEDPRVAGGFAHSGGFLLVDKEGHIRGHYDGTRPEEVDELLVDLEILLRAYHPE